MKKENYQKIAYINTVMAHLERIRMAFQKLNDHWAIDFDYRMDLNDTLQTMYPFACSFDELQKEVNMWVQDASTRLLRERKALEPNLANRNIVEEDQSPYVPIPAQFGRPFTIRHCVNCGQRLMVDPLDFLLNVDKDVICDACKNPKKYEKEEKAIRL